MLGLEGILSHPIGSIKVIHAAPRGFQEFKRKGVLAVVSTESSAGELP